MTRAYCTFVPHIHTHWDSMQTHKFLLTHTRPHTHTPHILTQTLTHTYKHACTYTLTHTHHTHMYIYPHIYAHTCTHAHSHTHTHTHTNKYIQSFKHSRKYSHAHLKFNLLDFCEYKFQNIIKFHLSHRVADFLQNASQPIGLKIIRPACLVAKISVKRAVAMKKIRLGGLAAHATQYETTFCII